MTSVLPWRACREGQCGDLERAWGSAKGTPLLLGSFLLRSQETGGVPTRASELMERHGEKFTFKPKDFQHALDGSNPPPDALAFSGGL